VEREPSLPEPHRGLGEALLGEGSLPRAELELERSLALDPSQWEAPALLGYLHQQRGEEDRAIRFYEESLSRKHDQPELEQNLGVLYSTRPGGKEEALRHLRRCLEMSPSPTAEERVKALILKLEGGAGPGN
jgi:Flp pilus assembly protein TadD